MMSIPSLVRSARGYWRSYVSCKGWMPEHAIECRGKALAYLEMARDIKGIASTAQNRIHRTKYPSLYREAA